MATISAVIEVHIIHFCEMDRLNKTLCTMFHGEIARLERLGLIVLSWRDRSLGAPWLDCAFMERSLAWSALAKNAGNWTVKSCTELVEIGSSTRRLLGHGSLLSATVYNHASIDATDAE